MRRTMRASRQTTPLFEPLEGRQLLTAALGTNLIVNPGAESNTGATNTTAVVSPSGWTHNGHPSADKYGASGSWPTSTSPGPSSRGNNFFAGGPTDMESDLFQTIDVSSLATQIDAKKIHFNLSGFLGGSGSQGDNVTLFANFQSSSGFISQTDIGPVTASNRGNKTELLSKSITGTLPVGTRKVQIQMHFERTDGTYDDAYADNLSFVLTNPTVATTGTVTGSVFKDTNGNGIQSGSTETALSSWMVYIDANNNGQFDPGETFTTTNSSGAFTLTLKPGKYLIRVQVRSGFAETTPKTFGFTATVAAGGSITGEKFGMKPVAAA